MEKENIGQEVTRKTKSIVKKIAIVAVVLGVAIFAFVYWTTYDDGVIAGKVLRISKKGVIFTDSHVCTRAVFSTSLTNKNIS